MAKTSMINKNERRRAMTANKAETRAALKATIYDRDVPMEERFEAVLKLAAMPRNSSKTRIRNRCEVTGRPRAFYRKTKTSRIALREMALKGLIPGMTKSSW